MNRLERRGRGASRNRGATEPWDDLLRVWEEAAVLLPSEVLVQSCRISAVSQLAENVSSVSPLLGAAISASPRVGTRRFARDFGGSYRGLRLDLQTRPSLPAGHAPEPGAVPAHARLSQDRVARQREGKATRASPRHFAMRAQ